MAKPSIVPHNSIVKNQTLRRLNPLPLLAVLLVVNLTIGSAEAALSAAEIAARTDHAATNIELESVLVDQNGQLLPGVNVRLSNAQSAVDIGVAVTDSLGYFLLTDLPRENAMLEIRAAGFRAKFIHVHLAKKRSVARVTLDPIVLDPTQNDEVRFLFGGDSAWGRRFYDSDLDGKVKLFEIPPSDPTAMIDTDDALPGTLATMQYVSAYFQAADFTSINLETPVLLTSPFTPHVEKDFAFFTLPDSLPVLNDVGIDYVALGNNHLWDYLEQGITDTRAALTSLVSGVSFSGAGGSEAEAIAPHQFDLKSHQYSMLSGTSVTGASNNFSDDSFLYVARDSAGKGGAADLSRDPFFDAIAAEADAGRIPIAQLHVGAEYTFEPTVNARRSMTDAADAGAGLVIAHHPHVAQGLEFYGPAQVLLAHSLGNLVFDQERLETMLGLTAQLDYAGEVFRRGRIDGVYLEDFRPRPIVAGLSATFLRRINEFSRDALVFSYNGDGWLQADEQATVQRDYTVTQQVQIGADGWAVVDLRNLTDAGGADVPPEASLRSVDANVDVTVKLGRDIMERHGEFEDWDVDDDSVGDPSSLAANSYASRWDWSSTVGAKFVCFDQPQQGMAAACSSRASTNISDTVIAFRNRIRLMQAESCGPIEPNREVTMFGYARGQNAGPMRAEIKYYPSREAQVSFFVNNEPNEVIQLGQGDFPWRPFQRDLTLPADDELLYPEPPPASGCSQVLRTYLRTHTARALRVFLDHSPPASGEGFAAFDGLAVINWEPLLINAARSATVSKWPHPLDFMRVEAPPNSSVDLNLVFSRRIPEVVRDIRVENYRDELFSDDFEA